jgi:NAD(P)-dependent dehydrogenase (short-subunit alcohol dehydrogenase family)
MAELDGKIAIITGAGSGMARATAKVFVREGARVLGADITGREKETAEELGDAFMPFHADVSKESDVEAIYAASKAGVISVTRQAAIDYATQGIRANAICPGLTITEMSGGRAAIENHPHLVEGAPMRRAGEPEEVAELASCLASDRSPFLTGAVIPIDGGLTATTP